MDYKQRLMNGDKDTIWKKVFPNQTFWFLVPSWFSFLMISVVKNFHHQDRTKKQRVFLLAKLGGKYDTYRNATNCLAKR